ncbi:MAG: LysR family transcriptional regulator [Sphingosinicella sp.]|nr:LysR family transcriptional regulator [Sphingosinicella sp.]
MNELSWDDLRLVLAIGRSGSLTGAAAELGVNVSTCSRRLTQLEIALQIVCFARRPTGVELTPAGQVVFSHSERIEQQTIALGRSLASLASSVRPRVTVTCPDSLAAALVIPAMRVASNKEEGPTVVLITDNRLGHRLISAQPQAH